MKNRKLLCVISGFCHEADANCTLLSYYAVSNGTFLPTFRDNLTVPSSRSLRNNREQHGSQEITMTFLVMTLHN